MATKRPTLARMLDTLEKMHGAKYIEPPRDVLGLVLWENVAYLVDDERRRAAFAALKKRVGLAPARIRAATHEVLYEVASLGGMHPAQRVERLREIADIALTDFADDLDAVLALPPAKARRALRKFPGIGEPGAEKILLFTRTEPVLALESNGLRALLRLGFGAESKNYSQSYKSAQIAVEAMIERDCNARIRAWHLLRAHGQALCKYKVPDCDACPLQDACAFAQRVG
jgi:endonuclease-3